MKWFSKLLKKIIPGSLHDFYIAALYDLNIRPTVNKKNGARFAKGIVVISADFEMAWACRFSRIHKNHAGMIGLRERENIPRLLCLFDEYRIPVTWATVGHLFLDSCAKDSNRVSHPDMPRPLHFSNANWDYTSGDWYDSDPGSDPVEAPGWYARDLIRKIIESPANHEIGCHTFSHIDCSPTNCDAALLSAELEACSKIAILEKVELKSFVFPGGTYGNFGVLKEKGFLSYRKEMKYQIDMPFIDEFGLIQLPSSCGLGKWKYNWSARKYVKVISSFIHKAAKSGQVSHLWFHPSMDRWYLEKVLPEILSNIKKMRDEGKVEVLTMLQLASRVLERESVS